ncbi:MAG: hypothetical protein KAG53_08585 [Endozoicomonadaceae bacterium]|nr:hypothetical protein [Endozoicomonadaceae bacterium]
MSKASTLVAHVEFSVNQHYFLYQRRMMLSGKPTHTITKWRLEGIFKLSNHCKECPIIVQVRSSRISSPLDSRATKP